MSNAQTIDTSKIDAPHVEVHPMSVHIGAEIHGVDLSKPLTSGEINAIRAALLRWKVVFFREQSLDHKSHVQFASQFGSLTPGHVVFGSDDEYPAIYSIAKHRAANSKAQTALRTWSGWHTDITAAVNPPAMSILRGDVVPPYGGDTYWTNLVVAFETLSPSLQGWLETLHGIHHFDPPTTNAKTSAYDNIIENNRMVARHPLVSVHPETGEKVLYISPAFLRTVEELSATESEALLRLLWEHAVLPEYTARFRWAPGSVAFWDNRATAHLAPRDIFATDFDRQSYRVTLMGDVPVGVNGESSIAMEGKPIEALATA